MRKTRLEKAMNNDFAKENPFDNIDQAILLAKELKVYDVIDPNGKTIHKIAGFEKKEEIIKEAVAEEKDEFNVVIVKAEPAEKKEYVVFQGSSGFVFDVNTGQRAFNTSAPTGFSALQQDNLP